MIAALYVQKGGAYYGLPDVDPWDEERDARKYAGPWPVVAHPPCGRWSMLASLVEATHGYRKGEDGGCFAAALTAVRKFGGVLEHPAFTAAWPHFGLHRPPRSGGWVVADYMGGWTCSVQQSAYGHTARKTTWLYAHGVELPSLIWGNRGGAVAWCGRSQQDLRNGRIKRAPAAEGSIRRLRGHRASATPLPFRDLLLSMASSALTDKRPL